MNKNSWGEVVLVVAAAGVCVQSMSVSATRPWDESSCEGVYYYGEIHVLHTLMSTGRVRL